MVESTSYWKSSRATSNSIFCLNYILWFIKFQDDLAFSILHSRGRKSLDLLASDTETRDNWVTGLEMLIRDSIGKPYTKITDRQN